LQEFNSTLLTDAQRTAGSAQGSATKAALAASSAISSAKEAKREGDDAIQLARGARQEADAYESQIMAALKQASEAESHLKGALAKAEEVERLAKGYEQEIQSAKRDASEAKALLAEARQAAAEAQQLAVNAAIGVKRLSSDRTLTDIPGLVAAISGFKNTEYAFSGVFADEESVKLLKQIDEALGVAGWHRAKGSHAFPSLEVFGKDDGVRTTVGSGVLVSVESPETLASLQALTPDKLPAPVGAAVALSLALASHIVPQDTEGRPVNVQPGNSVTVKILVGKKP
jgi:hypothetical protein